jgi:hypothetical protein
MNQTKNRTAPFSLPNAEQSYSVLKKWNGAAPFFFALEPNGPLMRLSLIMPGPPFSDWTALSHDRMRDWLCRPPHRLGLVSDSFSDLDTARTLSPLAPPVTPPTTQGRSTPLRPPSTVGDDRQHTIRRQPSIPNSAPPSLCHTIHPSVAAGLTHDRGRPGQRAGVSSRTTNSFQFRMLLVINGEQEMESRETPSAQKLACGEWGFFFSIFGLFI